MFFSWIFSCIYISIYIYNKLPNLSAYSHTNDWHRLLFAHWYVLSPDLKFFLRSCKGLCYILSLIQVKPLTFTKRTKTKTKQGNFIIGKFLCKHPLFCEGLSIHFSEINIENIRVVYPKAVIFYGNSRLKKAVMRVRAVKVTLYAHENLTFKINKN